MLGFKEMGLEAELGITAGAIPMRLFWGKKRVGAAEAELVPLCSSRWLRLTPNFNFQLSERLQQNLLRSILRHLLSSHSVRPTSILRLVFCNRSTRNVSRNLALPPQAPAQTGQFRNRLPPSPSQTTRQILQRSRSAPSVTSQYLLPARNRNCPKLLHRRKDPRRRKVLGTTWVEVRLGTVLLLNKLPILHLLPLRPPPLLRQMGLQFRLLATTRRQPSARPRLERRKPLATLQRPHRPGPWLS